MRCISVHFADLGPVDALFDPDRQWLVLRPSLTPPERRRAARRVLEQAGVPQPRVSVLVACRCGREVAVDPLGQSTHRRMGHAEHAARLATLVVGGTLTAVSLYAGPFTASAVADSPPQHGDPGSGQVLDRASWSATHDTFCNRRRGFCYDHGFGH